MNVQSCPKESHELQFGVHNT